MLERKGLKDRSEKTAGTIIKINKKNKTREQKREREEKLCGNPALKSLRPWHMYLLSRYEEEKQRPQLLIYLHLLSAGILGERWFYVEDLKIHSVYKTGGISE